MKILRLPDLRTSFSSGSCAEAIGTVSAIADDMAGVRNAHELNVWKLSDELRRRMREVLKRPGFSNQPDLKTQLDKSSESPCPNISEGFQRFFPLDNARFVRVAAGSLGEIPEHLNRALAHGLITAIEEQELGILARRARGAAKRYIVYLESAKEPYEAAGRRPRKRRPRSERKDPAIPRRGEEPKGEP